MINIRRGPDGAVLALIEQAELEMFVTMAGELSLLLGPGQLEADHKDHFLQNKDYYANFLTVLAASLQVVKDEKNSDVSFDGLTPAGLQKMQSIVKQAFTDEDPGDD